MIVTDDIAQVRAYAAELKRKKQRLGCVPTMGALHDGHMSLVAECSKHVDEVAATIFVNPTQFGAGEDLDAYPRPLEADLEKCEAAGVGLVYTPEMAALYPDGYDTWVTCDEMATILEGEFRPGHFRGVTTIVLKLFNIVQPDVAVFGAKDFQQQTMIRRMVSDLNVPVEIVVSPTIREADGLAMSSRNVYLNKEERQQALALSRALSLAEEKLQAGDAPGDVERAMLQLLKEHSLIRPQYVVIRDPATLRPLEESQESMVVLIAAYVGKTRLIDNRVVTDGLSG